MEREGFMYTVFTEQCAGFSMNVKEIAQIECMRTVRNHMRMGELREAYRVLQQAFMQYPENPHVLSSFGYLQAVLEKKYRAGIENCRKALSLEKRRSVTDDNDMPAELYLNLARAYMAAGRRKLALDSLEQGQRYDKKGELARELRSLGIRKRPPVPFLNRSNPINKYIGMMLHIRANDRRSFSPRA
jgi:tetratricopeptide (TPR) repeat protein